MGQLHGPPLKFTEVFEMLLGVLQQVIEGPCLDTVRLRVSTGSLGRPDQRGAKGASSFFFLPGILLSSATPGVGGLNVYNDGVVRVPHRLALSFAHMSLHPSYSRFCVLFSNQPDGIVESGVFGR